MKRYPSLILVMSLLMLLVAACNQATTPVPEMAAEPELEAAQQIGGNASCNQLLNNPTAYEIKIETNGINNNASYGPITFTGVNAGKTLMGFTSTVPVEAVFVKGGPIGGHLYASSAYATPGYAKYPATSDSNMGTGGYGDGRYQISHVSFCWNAPPEPPREALLAEKTADASYEREVSWTLDKSVDPETLSGRAGEAAGEVEWTVVADKTEVERAFSVTGTITIYNRNSYPVEFSVTDTLDDGTIASVTCPTYTVPAKAGAVNGSVTCTYTAEPEGRTAETNNAVITSLTMGVAGATAMAPLDWAETLIGYDSGTLSDPRFDFSEVISNDRTETFPETLYCPGDASLYENGEYQFTETNTATLNGNISLSDSASVVVTCTLDALEVEKDAAGTYDRTITWELDKSVNPSTLSGAADQAAGSVIWTVVADKTVVEDNYEVTGSITIDNPAAIPQDFTVEDWVNGTEADIDCPSYTVPAGGQVVCTYSAAVAGATLNTATVTAPGNDPVEATADVSYTANVIGYESGTLSDPRFDYEGEILGDTTETFTETLYCPADTGQYVDGRYSFTETNTAYLNGNIGLEASATVTVTCVSDIQRPSIQIQQNAPAPTRSVSNGTATWTGSFIIYNASGGDQTIVTLGPTTVRMERRAQGSTTYANNCTVTFPNGNVIAPRGSVVANYTCTNSWTGSGEFKAGITVQNMTNQLGEVRGGPAETWSRSVTFR